MNNREELPTKGWLQSLSKDLLVAMTHKQAVKIQELQSVSKLAIPVQWIPVSARLPEYETPVIISIKGEVKYSAYMLCVTDGCDEWFEEINGIGPDIINIETVDGWMPWPLPAAYKIGE